MTVKQDKQEVAEAARALLDAEEATKKTTSTHGLITGLLQKNAAKKHTSKISEPAPTESTQFADHLVDTNNKPIPAGQPEKEQEKTADIESTPSHGIGSRR